MMPISIMLCSIMLFINREAELGRLNDLLRGREGRLAVLYGRRRVGKTRLLLEWTGRNRGLYTVADQSSPDVQRRYFATAVAGVFSGFADVEYPDWASLLTRLAREASAAKWKGPLVIDELPYLALGAPELASVLQRFVDHDARQAGLRVGLAGSSQRMMQGLVLSSSAPLYGRAQALFEVRPLSAKHLRVAFPRHSAPEICELYTAWGGIPRYWELAREAANDVLQQIDALVLDPLGPLHDEPDRLLLEELPPAVELRPILDAIGLGVHRVSEIAGRIGRQATSLGRPLGRLQEMGLVRRETPFGDSSQSKRSLYKLDDPFVRFWFEMVAPRRGALLSSRPPERMALLHKQWTGLVAAAFEDLGRQLLPDLSTDTPLGKLGPWQAGRRWWQGNLPEWDLVSRSVGDERLLLGEIKWSKRPFSRNEVLRLAHAVTNKTPPILSARDAGSEIVRALVLSAVEKGQPRTVDGVRVVTAEELLRA
jgi:AAA+ ATPase superfamily predicted ATPase